MGRSSCIGMTFYHQYKDKAFRWNFWSAETFDIFHWKTVLVQLILLIVSIQFLIYEATYNNVRKTVIIPKGGPVNIYPFLFLLISWESVYCQKIRSNSKVTIQDRLSLVKTWVVRSTDCEGRIKKNVHLRQKSISSFFYLYKTMKSFQLFSGCHISGRVIREWLIQ
jgi:hypothetical protein